MSHTLSMVTRTVLIALLSAGALFGCQKGPGQETGEKIDKAIDKLTGTGPAEKAGERIDEAVKTLKQ
jgi:hypothetical protein